MISTEFAIALMGIAVAIGLSVLGRRKQNGNGVARAELKSATDQLMEENRQLRASADFLLAQNVALSKTTDLLHDEVASLKHEVSRLRQELGDAQALLRNMGPRST
jgi:hypothetical protein